MACDNTCNLPRSQDTRSMKIESAEFEKSAPSYADCPEASLPEFAFVGRSNVGKSSLINMLTGKDKLATVSSTPGRTQMINFFQIDRRWKLVDLPGYGYAKTSKKNKERFREFVSEYLLEREPLLCVFVLIDSRLPPQPIDLAFTQWLVESEIPFVLVYTKADKTKPGALEKTQKEFLKGMEEYCEAPPRTFITSANKRDGRKDLLEFIQLALSASNEN